MGQSPRFALPWPELSDPADGPAAFEALATAVDEIVSAPQLLAATIGEGVVTSGGLAVTPDSPAGLSVRVAAGPAIVRLASGRVRHLTRPSLGTLAIGNPHGTWDRFDLVVAADPGPDSNVPAVSVVQGTAAANPVLPSLPADAIRLAQVRVRAATSTVVAGDVTDLRQPFSADPQAVGKIEAFFGSHSVPWGYIAGPVSVPAARYPRLASLLGIPSSGTITIPDLADRFLVGAGGALTVGDVGGAAQVTLTAAQMPSHTHTTPNHTHTGTTSGSGSHTHGMDAAGAHAHGLGVFNTASGVQVGPHYPVPRYDGGGSPIALGTDGVGAHSHGIHHGGDHSHLVTIASSGGGATGSAGSGQAHENRPPYRAVTFAVRV